MSDSHNRAAPERGRPRAQIDHPVLIISAAVSAAFVILGVTATERLMSVATTVKDHLIRGFGWVFVLSSAFFVALAIYLAVSRYGRIRLGADGEKPEFRTASWIAMMFSAGMGIGLMFFGAAEPLYHLTSPPMGLAKPQTEEAAQVAMEYSYFHWAFHPWAMYAVVGLALAYFCFRKGKPNLISTAFFPLLGDRARGGWGKAIDIFAIFATLFGSATSLGLGALQINSGLNNLWQIPQSDGLAIAVIAALTIAFVVSAVTGVHRGIKFLSNTNMLLAVLLLAFLFVVGPTVFILNTLSESFGGYLTGLPGMSFRAGAFGGQEWLSAWTIFYWAWWISWTPFVGTFIARISRGRTIREFVLGVVLAPSVVSFIWFAILGGAAIDLQLNGRDVAEGGNAAEEAILFNVLREYPLFTVTAVVVIILVALFFVSGADAASVVMGTLSSRGAIEPGRGVTTLWGVLTGLVAAVLLLAHGSVAGKEITGLDALQTLCILAAAPFLLIMIGAAWALLKELRREPREATAGVTRREDTGPATSDQADVPVTDKASATV